MSNQEELFTKLLNQLQLKDQIDSDNFKGGQIEKIDIHKRSKIWEFHLTLPRILDYEVFLDFYSRMQATFDEIATTKINIKANDNQFDNKQLGNYWEWMVKHADITDAIKNELLLITKSNLVLITKLLRTFLWIKQLVQLKICTNV